MKFIILLCFLGWSSVGWGRVFDIKSETFGSYFKGTYASGLVGKSMFESSSGTGVTFDKTADYNFSGEFGFLWARSFMVLRLGAEVIRTRSLQGTKGTDASDVELYKMNSDVNVFNPKVGVEFSFFRSSIARAFFGGSVGQATVTVQNSYAFTSAGNTTFNNLADFTEAGTQTVTSAEGLVGFECLFSDTTTFVFDAGYRSLKASALARKADVTTFDGAQTAGEPLKNSDGTQKTLDMSGLFVGLAFRFYL